METFRDSSAVLYYGKNKHFIETRTLKNVFVLTT